jgi:PAS domain S-box-containing protein
MPANNKHYEIPDFRYALYGIFIGLLFPITITLYELISRGLTLTIGNLIHIHSLHPSILIIDILPAIFGLLGWLIDRKSTNFARSYLDLSADLDNLEHSKRGILENEEKFRMISEQSLMAILIIQDDEIKYANQAVANLLGIQIKDIISKQVGELAKFVHRDDWEFVTEQLRKKQLGEEDAVVHYSYRWITGEGGIIWVDQFSKTITYQGKNADLAIVLDITEKKITENVKTALYKISEASIETENLHELFESIHKILGAFIDTSDFYVALYDEPRDMYSFPYSTGSYDGLDFAQEQLRKSLTDYVRRTEKPLLIDESLHKKFVPPANSGLSINRSWLWLGVPLKTSTGVIGVIALQGDSETNRYTRFDLELMSLVSGHVALAIERKLADRSLMQTSEKRRELENIVNRSQAVAFLWQAKEELPVEFVSENVRQFGFTPEDFYEQRIPFARLIHPEDMPWVMEEIAGYNNRNLQEFEQEYRIVTRDGEVRWVDVRTWVRRGDDDTITHYQVILLDITDRKHTQEALKYSKNLLLNIMDQSPLSTWIADRKGLLIKLNAAGKNLFGIVSDDSVIGNYNLFADPVIKKQGYYNNLKRVFESGEVARFILDYNFSESEYFKASDNRSRLLDVTIFPIKDESGNVENVVIQHDDITEKYQAIRQLQESEERYRILFDNANEGIFIVQDGKLKFFNPRLIELTGYAEEEIAAMFFAQMIHEGDRELVINRHNALLKGESVPGNYNFRIIDKNGNIRWLEINAVRITWADKPATLNFAGDATNRILAEQALKESEEKHRLLTENLKDVVIRISTLGNIEYCSPAIKQFGGYDPREVVGKNIKKYFVRPHEYLKAFKLIKEVVFNKKGSSMEFLFRAKDKESFYVEVTGEPVIIDNKTTCIQVVMRDISERRRAEEAIRESEEKFRSLAEQSPNMIFINKKGKVVYANDKCVELMGYTKEEFCSPEFNFLRLMAPESLEKVKRIFAEHIQGQEIKPYDYVLVTKDGKRINAINNSRIIKYEGDEAILGVVTDITARKQVELALKNSEIQYRTTIDSIKDIIHVVDKDLNVILLNKSARELAEDLGFDIDSMGKNLCDIAQPLSADAIREDYAKVFNTGTPSSTVENFVFNGREFIVEILKTPVFEENRVARVVTVIHNITEYKKAENALKKSEKKYRLLIESLNEGIWMIDKDNCTTFVNPRMAEMLGCPIDRMPGKQLFSFMDEKNVELCKQYLAKRERSIRERQDLEFINQNGERIYTSIAASPIVDNEGNSFGTIIAVHDITDRRRAGEMLRQSEEKFRNIVEYSAAGIVLTDEFGDIIEWNRSQEKMTGLKREEVLGLPLWEIQYRLVPQAKRNPEIQNMLKSSILELLKTGNSPYLNKIIEHEIEKTDGRIIFAQVLTSAIKKENGVMLCSLVRDVTDRLLARKALRESEEMFKNISQTAKDAIIMMGPEGEISFWNKAAEQIFGYRAEEILGKNLHQLLAPQRFLDSHEKALPDFQTGGAGAVIGKTTELYALKKDRSEFPIELSVSSFQRDGKWHAVGILRDISERKRAELALKESDSRNQELFNSVLEGIGIVDENELILYCNPAFAGVFEVISPDDLTGKNLMDFMSEPQKKLALAQTAERRKGATSRYELEIITAKGNSKIVLCSVSPRYDENKKCIGSFGTIIDITERKRAEKALKESEEKFRQVIETAPVVIWSQSALNGTISVISPSIETLTGYTPDELISSNNIFDRLAYTEDKDKGQKHLRLAVKDKEQQSFEMRLAHKRGMVKIVSILLTPGFDVDGKLVRIDGIAIDITDKKLLESQIVQSEKMAAVGLLAAGVAHEFNNLLGGIMGNLSFAENYPGDTGLCLKCIKESLNATERAADLVQSLLSYSRRKDDTGTNVHVNDILEDIIKLVGKEIKHKAIKLIKNYREVPAIKAKPGQLQQVFLNILINAIQAVQESGLISISVWAGNDKVYIEFADNGTGITKENIEKIFDPFFSTKGIWHDGKSRGTGLGLSISHNIIKDHGGDILVHSLPDSGTEFTIVLPVGPQKQINKDDLIFAKKSDVLIVEFDAEQAENLNSILKEFNCRSYICSWSDEVKQVLNNKTFDLVFLDASHPAMVDFLKLFDYLISKAPTAPIILGSRGPVKYQYEEVLNKSTCVIYKPYTFENVAYALANLGEIKKETSVQKT